MDTINEGVPISSSLTRTTAATTTKKGVSPIVTLSLPSYVEDEIDVQALKLLSIGERIAYWIVKSALFTDYMRSADHDRFSVSLDSRGIDMVYKINFSGIRYCRARKKQTRSAEHKTNTIYFVIIMTGENIGLVEQYCASQTCLSSNTRINGLEPECTIPNYFIDQLEEVLGKQRTGEACLFLEDDDDDL